MAAVWSSGVIIRGSRLYCRVVAEAVRRPVARSQRNRCDGDERNGCAEVLRRSLPVPARARLPRMVGGSAMLPGPDGLRVNGTAEQRRCHRQRAAGVCALRTGGVGGAAARRRRRLAAAGRKAATAGRRHPRSEAFCSSAVPRACRMATATSSRASCSNGGSWRPMPTGCAVR